jgi:hypothetical protein
MNKRLCTSQTGLIMLYKAAEMKINLDRAAALVINRDGNGD